MPYACVVLGCSNRSNRETFKGYFRVPREEINKGPRTKDFTKRRREKWLANISLTSNGAKSKNARVCGDHFVKGRPSNLYDESDIDWAPTRSLGHEKVKQPTAETLGRDELHSRDEKRKRSECAEALAEFHKLMRFDTSEIQSPDIPEDGETNAAQDVCPGVACQTDLTGEDIVSMEQELNKLNCEHYELQSKALDTAISKESFEKSNDKTKFYTGLPNFLVLMQVFSLCEPYISASPLSSLDKFRQLILVLMRLRLNLPLKDLAYRFEISESTACRIFREVLSVLNRRLLFLIEWPHREALRATMPMEFRQAFGSKVAVIIDRLEVFIERPSNLLARAQTWSNYKHHNTVKFLIGITPQGHVSFISKAWGGRVSDKKITEDSGFLDHILPGDIVLADCGFTIADSEDLHSAALKISAFTKGKSDQLSPCDVEETRKIASVRIHVERVIGLVRRKYQILQSRAMMLEHMAVEGDDGVEVIDKIGVVCCALTNLSESVVPSE
ncbi:unnamed protein product [Knipowitschia caucasica]